MPRHLIDAIWSNIVRLEAEPGKAIALIHRSVREHVTARLLQSDESQNELSASLTELADRVFDRDLFKIASQLRGTVDAIDEAVTGDDKDKFVRAHLRFGFLNVYDDIAVESVELRQSTLSRVNINGLHLLECAIAMGQGVIFYSAFQSSPCFIRGISNLAAVRVGLVRHQGHGTSKVFSDPEWNFVEIPAAAFGARAILSLLKARDIVGVYGDFAYSESRRAESSLFGKSVLISRAMARLAISTGAPLVAVSASRRDLTARSIIDLTFFRHFTFGGYSHLSESDVSMVAVQFGVVLECLIRRHPAQWRLWNSLDHRWNEARNIND